MTDTPIADMVAKMLAESVSAAVIVLAVRTAELSLRVPLIVPGDEGDSRDVAREKARLKKARQRANRKQNSQANAGANDAAMGGDVSPGVPGDKGDSRCDSSFFPDSQVSKEGTEQVPRARARGTRLAEDAQPTAADLEFARENGVVDVRTAWQEFRDYWIAVPGQRGLKTNWPATWRNRVRKITGRGGPGGPGPGQRRPSGNSGGHAAILQQLDERDQQDEPEFFPPGHP